MPLLPLILSLSLTAAPTDDAVEAETAAWHAKRLQRLTAEDGWLTLVALHWLDEGDTTAGSAKGSALELPPSAPAKLGVFTREGKSVRFAPAAPVLLGGKPFAGGELKTDASQAPDILTLGSLRFYVIQRGEKLAVRVKDAEAPARKHFTGIQRYPGKAAWRVEAKLIPAKSPVQIPVPTVLGTIEPMPSPGKLAFSIAGKSYELTPVMEEPGSLFIIFGDQSNSDATYGSGRFLDAPLPTSDGKVVLDFNRATNPPCAFSKFATCPLPPRGNRLSVRVEAGEKRYGSH